MHANDFLLIVTMYGLRTVIKTCLIWAVMMAVKCVNSLVFFAWWGWSKVWKRKGGLYGDAVMMTLESLSGPAADKMRKEMIQLFKNHGLSVTVETHLHLTDFLDVTFDLKNDKFYPYRKPNDTPLYINTKSNNHELLVKHLSMVDQ